MWYRLTFSFQGNREGGEWLVRLNKGLAARCWENLVMAILGEQFGVGDEICGAGVSMRQKKDCISLWNKTSADHETTEKIRDMMRKVLNLPSHFQLEYRCHKDVLQWLNTRDGGGPSAGPPGKPRSASPTMESMPLRGFNSGLGGAPGLHPPTSSSAHR